MYITTMRKILIGVIITLAFLSIIGYAGSNWAERKIHQEIEALSFLSYDSLDIDVFGRALEIFNLRGIKAGYDGEIEVLKIKGLQLMPILTGKRFVIDEISMDGVRLNYQLDVKSVDETLLNDQSDKEKIPKFEVMSIDLDDGYFALSDRKDSLLFNTRLSVLLQYITDEDLRNPGSLPSKLKSLETDSALFVSGDRLYSVSFGKSAFENEVIKLQGVRVKSELEKFEYGKYIGHEIDWFNASVDSISIEITDLKSVFKTPRIKRMDIYHPSLHVFRDKRLPSPKDHFPRLLRHILGDEDLKFAFDSICIKNGEFRYEEFVKAEKGPGELALQRLNADITNLKSYSLGLTERPRLIATCRLYDQAELFADISFPQNERARQTLVKGKLMPIDLTVLNRMIQYVSIIDIKSGKSKMLEFDFSYTDTLATGEMKFAYNDLKIEFLEKQESEPDGIISAVKSFLVNSLVIDRNNNFESEKFRIGKIEFERVREKSMFNYWWGAILTGFKSSTGVDTSGEKIDVN